MIMIWAREWRREIDVGWQITLDVMLTERFSSRFEPNTMWGGLLVGFNRFSPLLTQVAVP